MENTVNHEVDPDELFYFTINVFAPKFYGFTTARIRKKRFGVSAPYVPGSARVQFTKSLLDSMTISTGPEASVGITTVLLGRLGDESLVVVFLRS